MAVGHGESDARGEFGILAIDGSAHRRLAVAAIAKEWVVVRVGDQREVSVVPQSV